MQRLSDKVYEEIKSEIISGGLKGNTFVVESDVAARYGVSKAPVKTALQQLAQEGYLLCFPRRGYMVTTVSAEEYAHVREIRSHLEQLSVRLAVERASDSEIDSLEDVIRGGVSAYKSNNTRFHIRLAEITHNPYLVEVMQKLLVITARFAIAYQTDNRYHEQIIDALRRRDTDAALASLAQDLHSDKK